MEEFVTFDIAKKLKEKGFNWKVYAYYGIHGNRFNVHPAKDMNDCEYRCSAPTISQVLKWLREEKKISVQPLSTRGNRWESQITFTDENDKKLVEKFLDGSFWAGRRSKTYEEAALAGIQYVIDNLI